jgi:hypothetical protein
MSTIRVDNFGPSAGGTTYSARGIAKAWVNFNGTNTIATRDSQNVSSLTDIGTGQYNTNFASSFTNANFSCVGIGQTGGAFSQHHTMIHQSSFTSSLARFHSGDTFAQTTAADVPCICGAVYGDLA